MVRTRKPARYPGKITMVPLSIRNCPAEGMREKVIGVPFLAYHVETLADGRKVCITKPGGKATWGKMKADDFMVWVYDEARQDRWRVDHEEPRTRTGGGVGAPQRFAWADQPPGQQGPSPLDPRAPKT